MLIPERKFALCASIGRSFFVTGRSIEGVWDRACMVEVIFGYIVADTFVANKQLLLLAGRRTAVLFS